MDGGRVLRIRLLEETTHNAPDQKRMLPMTYATRVSSQTTTPASERAEGCIVTVIDHRCSSHPLDNQI